MSAPRFTTLLLDLDGTLLDVEMRSFLEAFFPLAAARFGGPAERRRISQAMGEAARAMMEARDGARTVDLVFLETFAAAVGCDPRRRSARFSPPSTARSSNACTGSCARFPARGPS